MTTHRRLAILCAAAAALGLALVPVAGASHQFSDVPSEHPFHDEIGIFKDTNITSGCTATEFCPQDFVRRQAMAAFIDRALGLLVRPGETDRIAIPGSRVALIDDGSSFVGTSADGLELSYGGTRAFRVDSVGNVVGGYLAALASNGNGVPAGIRGAAIGGGGEPGFPNRVTDNFGTVAGGRGNRAGNDDGTAFEMAATVAGGEGNVAAGRYSTVPGGRSNAANGQLSLAAGHRAKANHTGAFVWADSVDADFASTAANQFSVRSGGGIRLLGPTGVGRDALAFAGRGDGLVVQGPISAGGDNVSGCHIYVGDDICLRDFQNGKLAVRNVFDTGWAAVQANTFEVQSSLSAKKDVSRLGARGAQAMLRSLERLGLYRYRYRNEPTSRVAHTGVIAERSPAQILSDDGKALSVSDFAAVTAGATKALAARVKGLSRENRALRSQAKSQAARLAALERRLAALEAAR